MADTYAYLGEDVRAYLSYADTETDLTLVAEPGKSYGIRAIEGHAIPPNDGRWAEDPDPVTEVDVPSPRRGRSSQAAEPTATDDPSTETGAEE